MSHLPTYEESQRYPFGSSEHQRYGHAVPTVQAYPPQPISSHPIYPSQPIYFSHPGYPSGHHQSYQQHIYQQPVVTGYQPLMATGYPQHRMNAQAVAAGVITRTFLPQKSHHHHGWRHHHWSHGFF